MKKGNPNKCWYCGQEEKCTKDHFFPKSRGGGPLTIVWACRICQGAKSDMMPEEWVNYIRNHKAFTTEAKRRIITATLSLLEKINENSKIPDLRKPNDNL